MIARIGRLTILNSSSVSGPEFDNNINYRVYRGTFRNGEGVALYGKQLQNNAYLWTYVIQSGGCMC